MKNARKGQGGAGASDEEEDYASHCLVFQSENKAGLTLWVKNKMFYLLKISKMGFLPLETKRF